MKRILILASVIAAGALLAGESPRVPARANASPVSAASGLPGSMLVTNRAGLNFQNDPLDQVLDYLSEELGFIINKEAPGPGTVSLGGQAPADREEALEWLNSALQKTGHTMVRQGRILTLTSLERGRTADLDVVVGNDPAALEKAADGVTQIIPVRYSGASALASNLRVLLPSTVSLTVNESANTILLAASKTDIRRALKVVAILDSAVASVSTVKVIRLHYADAKQLATIVQQMFGSAVSTQVGGGGNGSPMGGPGGGFGPPGGPGSDDAAQTGSATRNRGSATATSDDFSNALIVSAPEGVMPAVSSLVAELDHPVTEVTEMRVFQLQNADPSELANQLAELFPDTTQSGASQNQAAARFGGPPGPPEMQEAEASASDPALKKTAVVAVADPRTSSLLVSAPATRMPVIAGVIASLDAVPARKEVVKAYDLRNAGPQDVNQALQDLFNRNSASRSSNSRSSLIGDSNPLTVRATRQQSTTSSSGSSRGSSGGASGAGGAGGAGGGGGGGGGF